MATTQNRTTQLGEKPIGKLLLTFSLPAIVSTTIISLYNIISGIFIGQGEGALAITGLAITFPFMNLILAICMLVAIGAATICSIELGAQNDDNAKMILGNSIVLSLIFSIAFTLVCLPLLDPILKLFGASESSLPYARAYMEVILWGAPIGSIMITLNHIMRASGYPTKSMVMSLISVGINLIFTPIFIFYYSWGIRGAAMATVLAQTVAIFCMLPHFFNKTNVVSFRSGIFKLRRSTVKSILAIGLSPFLMNACACLVIIVINLSLFHYGGDLAIGAYGIANRLLLFFLMVIVGLTQGMQPLVGYNFGARRFDRVQETLRYGIISATAIMFLGFLSFQLTPRFLASLFSNDAELTELAVRGLRICSAVFFLVGAQIVISAYFQSLGRASIAIFLSLSRQLVFLIPGLIILPLFLGLDGVWVSIPVADTLAFTVAFVILRYAQSSKTRPGK